MIVRPYDGQNCQNMVRLSRKATPAPRSLPNRPAHRSLSSPPTRLQWNFVNGHQDKILNNTCAIWQTGENGNPKDADMVMTQNDNGSCDPNDPSHPIM